MSEAWNFADTFSTMAEDMGHAISQSWLGEYLGADDRAIVKLPEELLGSQKMQVGDRVRIYYVAQDRSHVPISAAVLKAFREKLERDKFFIEHCKLLNVTYNEAENRIFVDVEVLKNPWPFILLGAAIVGVALAIGLTFSPEKVVPLIEEGISSIKWVAIAVVAVMVFKSIHLFKA